MASEWMTIADEDDSNTISFDEIKDFILKVDENMGEEEIKAVFNQKDVNCSGELSNEEFGQAFFEIFKDKN